MYSVADDLSVSKVSGDIVIRLSDLDIIVVGEMVEHQVILPVCNRLTMERYEYTQIGNRVSRIRSKRYRVAFGNWFMSERMITNMSPPALHADTRMGQGRLTRQQVGGIIGIAISLE